MANLLYSCGMSDEMKLRGEKGSDVTDLRGSMAGLMERRASKLPSRFTMERSVDSPSMWFTDTETGKTVDIGLCHVNGVIEALVALFGEE